MESNETEGGCSAVRSTDLLGACYPCGVLFGDGSLYGPGPKDETGCRLPIGHDGPHEFVAKSGAVFNWETDFECECDQCMRADGDFCSIYWPAPNAADKGRARSA
jgi:hypothetical protein